MEVQSLKLAITDEDLNGLLKKYLPPNVPVEELSIRITPEGMAVTGIYPLFINVHFESVWELGVDQGRVTARFDKFKAMGVPANIFKSAIVKMIEDVAAREEWIRIEGDTLLVDVDACLAKFAVPTRTNIKNITCGEGLLVVEGAV